MKCNNQINVLQLRLHRKSALPCRVATMDTCLTAQDRFKAYLNYLKFPINRNLERQK